MRLVSLALFFLSLNAQAGPLVEPYVGYALGVARPTGAASPRQWGPTYGGRLGYQTWGAMAGVDYQTGAWRDSASPSNALIPAQLGVFFGYNLPILMRAYIEFIPIARLTAEHAGFDRTFDGGEAVKYGIGFTGLPFVSVNVEYVTAHHRGLDTEMWSLNVSLPVVF